MKEVTLKIPDGAWDFFLELISRLGIEVSRAGTSSNDDIHIPEEHKEIVLKRIREAEKNPELMLNWDEVKSDFDLD